MPLSNKEKKSGIFVSVKYSLSSLSAKELNWTICVLKVTDNNHQWI